MMKSGFYWVMYNGEMQVAEYLEDSSMFLITGCENTHVKEEFEYIHRLIIPEPTDAFYDTESVLKAYKELPQIPAFKNGGFSDPKLECKNCKLSLVKNGIVSIKKGQTIGKSESGKPMIIICPKCKTENICR